MHKNTPVLRSCRSTFFFHFPTRANFSQSTALIRKSTQPKWKYERIPELKQGDASKDNKGKSNGKANGKDNTPKNDAKPADKPDEAKGGDGDNTLNFTEEQDKTLREMKGNNKSWKEIVEATGRARHDCTKRWKELNDKAAGGNEDGKADDKKDETDEKKKDNKEQGKGKQKGKEKAKQDQNEAEDTGLAEYVRLEEDEEFSTELVRLPADSFEHLLTEM